MEKTKRTYDDIQRLARHLGDKLALIDKHMTRCPSIQGLAETLSAIFVAMQLIADTPNASVNNAALEAFSREVDTGLEVIERWAKDLLKPDAKLGMVELWDDEIPF